MVEWNHYFSNFSTYDQKRTTIFPVWALQVSIYQRETLWLSWESLQKESKQQAPLHLIKKLTWVWASWGWREKWWKPLKDVLVQEAQKIYVHIQSWKAVRQQLGNQNNAVWQQQDATWMQWVWEKEKFFCFVSKHDKKTQSVPWIQYIHFFTFCNMKTLYSEALKEKNIFFKKAGVKIINKWQDKSNKMICFQ